eukprot:scaffold5311_cov120-Isochrysis_galbana.AAC.8
MLFSDLTSSLRCDIAGGQEGWAAPSPPFGARKCGSACEARTEDGCWDANRGRAGGGLRRASRLFISIQRQQPHPFFSFSLSHTKHTQRRAHPQTGAMTTSPHILHTGARHACTCALCTPQKTTKQTTYLY